MVHIIGGAKSAVNLYKVLKKNNIPGNYYFFKGEFGQNKEGGLLFDQFWNGNENIGKADKIIISSETAFNKLNDSDRDLFSIHFFLRNKLNLPEVSDKIAINAVQTLAPDLVSPDYPIIVKPFESSTGKVPFKFKVLHNASESDAVKPYLANCILQPYLSDAEYRQYAIAGYFNGSRESLIAVMQKNQYPTGISSYVRLEKHILQDVKQNITDYLNEIEFKGFIEFEIKYNVKSRQSYLLDINPRTWGWSYFYISGIKNLGEVILENRTPDFKIKNVWINAPRLALSFSKLRFASPGFSSFIKNEICYEPFQ